MFRFTRVPLALALLAVACHGKVSDQFLMAGRVENTQVRPDNATPSPNIPRELQATGAMLVHADVLPGAVEPCAFPARQLRHRVLVYWTADTKFAPASVESAGDFPKNLEKMHISIRGHISRRNNEVRACSLFADAIGTGNATPAP